ncbi:DoxX family protein [Terricaulis silvestris]|uniref:Inner membrane protein YqjF n=1 Tax=Terricaulis silvestris TaxID=2686094 RepID=A0A6I6MRG4_9CAUL|nr:DoxX family protein [Terricaulis silvestris]QGZ93733.1 Inner membrane protein YqjF [Terricaulis silvestris]
MSKNADLLALIGRILMTSLILVSGTGKILAPAATVAYMDSLGIPAPAISIWIAAAIEVGGGLLLILGWQTRALAVLLSVFAVVTAYYYHRNISDPNQLFHFMKNMAVTGGFFQLMAFGAGRYSLDARRVGGA